MGFSPPASSSGRDRARRRFYRAADCAGRAPRTARRARGAREKGRVRVLNDLRRRIDLTLAALGPAPKTIVFQPEPRWIGDAEAAHALLAGRYRLAGREIVAPGVGPWRLIAPTEAFEQALHGFAWLDDLAAAATREARRAAQSWTFGWIAQYGDGAGPGWRPETAGRRLRQWLLHAPLILHGAEPDLTRRFMRSCALHARHLERAWRRAEPGLGRIEAATGALYAALALDALRPRLPRLTTRLGLIAERELDGDGGLPSRNPEELCEALETLATAARTLEAAGVEPDPRHLDALRRAAPALRALRLSDGSLARFHGGGAGAPGRADHALTQANVRGAPRADQAMGFHRMAAGRTVAIVDAAAPPRTRWAQASTLGFELSCAGRPLIVAPGPGHLIDPQWAERCRATAAHSTLSLERASSSRVGARARGPAPRPFAHVPGAVAAETADDAAGEWLMCSHDGYAPTHGLLHERRLFLAPDGRDFRGEDTLSAPTARARRRFDAVVEGSRSLGVAFAVRFTLHPEVEVEPDPRGLRATLTLPDAAWTFVQEGGRIAIEEAPWIPPDGGAPRATKQIVVNGRVKEYWGRVTWAFRRADPPRPHLRPVA